MLSSQEQQVWDDVQRFWELEAEEPSRLADDVSRIGRLRQPSRRRRSRLAMRPAEAGQRRTRTASRAIYAAARLAKFLLDPRCPGRLSPLRADEGAVDALIGLATRAGVDIRVCRVFETEYVEQLSDLVLELRGVAHTDVAVEDIVIAPSHALARHIPSLDKVRNDSLRCAFRDAHCLGNVT